MKPVVEDPMDDDRIPVESGAEVTPVPPEPSESEKMKSSLTHHFNHGARHASQVKRKPNHTSEQSASSKTANSQFCNATTLKDVAAADGLNVLSMCAKTFG